MSESTQKLGAILIIDDEVVTFYKEIAKSLVKAYEVLTFISKEEVLLYQSLRTPKLALVDLNLNKDHDGFGVIDFLNGAYPGMPVLVVTKENVGVTVKEALKKENVIDVLIKSEYDISEWIKIIEGTIAKNTAPPPKTVYLTYDKKNSFLAQLIKSKLDATEKCKIIDDINRIKEAEVIIGLICKRVSAHPQNEVRNAVDWGISNRKRIEVVWIDETQRRKDKKPQPWSGKDMIADFSSCLKLLESKKMSILEAVLNNSVNTSDYAALKDAFGQEIKKIIHRL